MSSQGTIIARVFTSNARIPLRGAAVVFYRTDAGGARELLGLRLRDGRLYIEHPVLPEFSVRWTDDAGRTHTIERTPGGITVDGKSYDGGGLP